MLRFFRLFVLCVLLSFVSFVGANGNLPFANAPEAVMGLKPMGMHLPQSPWFLEKIDAMEDKLSRDIEVIHWFGSWEYEFEALPFKNVLASDRVALFTWQPIHEPPEMIARGVYDSYLRDYARSMAELDGQVIMPVSYTHLTLPTIYSV